MLWTIVCLFQYYYNSVTQQFMYWDAEQSTYLPAPGDGSDNGPMGPGTGEKKEGKDKKEKVKVAKKIAKVTAPHAFNTLSWIVEFKKSSNESLL